MQEFKILITYYIHETSPQRQNPIGFCLIYFQKGIFMEQKEKTSKQTPRKRISVIRTVAVREKSIFYEYRQICNSQQAAELGRLLVKDADKENLIVCCLDGKNTPVSIERVAIGIVNNCLVGMREIFKNAILSNTVGIIVFHNHPSGSVKPSQADIEITKKMKKAGGFLDIEVLDHIILGDDDFTSLADTLNWTGGNQKLTEVAEGRWVS